MSEESESLELFHAGVKGMKWGVRKDDKTSPRKLTKEERRERSASRIDKRASGQQAKIDKLRAKPGNFLTRGNRAKEATKREKLRDRAISDAEKKRSGKMTSTEKKLAIGASVTAALVATYATYKFVDSGEMSRLQDKGAAFLNSREKKLGPWDMNTDLWRNSFNDDPRKIKAVYADRVNPDFGEPGTKMNCRRATFAFEARRRGYDVQATRSRSGTGQNMFGLDNALSPGSKHDGTGIVSGLKKMHEAGWKEDKVSFTKYAQMGAGAETKISKSASETRGMSDSIFESLGKEPNRSRGELGVLWEMGGGHSMAYEIFKGKPVIFDTQTGKMFEDPESFAKYGGSRVGEAGFTRLDNKELNKEFLSKWVTNAK